MNSAVIALLVATAIWGIWGEIDDTWYGRSVGVESVLVAAVSLAIPVLWRFGGRGRDSTPPLRAVVECFIDGEVSFVVVEDGDGVSGVVSKYDVLQAIHDGADIEQIWAADIMSTEVITMEDTGSTSEAAHAAMTTTGRRFTTNG